MPGGSESPLYPTNYGTQAPMHGHGMYSYSTESGEIPTNRTSTSSSGNILATSVYPPVPEPVPQQTQLPMLYSGPDAERVSNDFWTAPNTFINADNQVVSGTNAFIYQNHPDLQYQVTYE